MKVVILATRSCNHRLILEERLKSLGVPYEVKYLEDNPDLMKKYQVHHSPNIIIDGEAVFKARTGKSLPTEGELAKLFGK